LRTIRALQPAIANDFPDKVSGGLEAESKQNFTRTFTNGSSIHCLMSMLYERSLKVLFCCT